MSLFRGLLVRMRVAVIAVVLGAAAFTTACTVQPLAGSSSSSAATTPAFRSIAVDEVTTRPAQQVRNALLFALHGGITPVETRYSLRLTVVSQRSALAIRSSTLAPTAAQVIMTTSYVLSETATGARVSSGQQKTIAAFDESSQSFADTRALRDAENRAASEAAQKIRLSLARDLARR